MASEVDGFEANWTSVQEPNFAVGSLVDSSDVESSKIPLEVFQLRQPRSEGRRWRSGR